MSESHVVGPGDSSAESTGKHFRNERDLWRQAEERRLPLGERIGLGAGAALAFGGWYSGFFDESQVMVLLFLGMIAYVSSLYRRQQFQIDALRKLLAQAVEREDAA